MSVAMLSRAAVLLCAAAPALGASPAGHPLRVAPDGRHLLRADGRPFIQVFTPPSSGRGCDWVLVLDDASKGYPPPGEALR
jgi:hypothetical protein